MAQQLRPQYKQTPGFIDIEVFAFDDFSMDVTFDTNVSTLSFEGGVVNHLGVLSPEFTITQLTPSGISVYLSDTDIELVPENSSYFIRGTLGTLSRTYLAGRFNRVERTD